MKNIKRVLCLVLTLLMVASTVSVFAAFSDVPTTVSYEKAVSALNQLGIIKGYDDGTFKPDNDVTRAEFTAMLMRTMGAGSIGSSSSADLPFSDVSDQNSDISWSIPNINTAYKNGIVNGYEDGTFRPNDKVAYEEAVKMVVCALGYGENISVDATPWYSNFMAQARSLGILKGAQNLGSAEKPASRACIAQMLYDSLEVSLVENGVVTTKTFLADYLGYIKNTGYISANDLTSLDDPDVNLRENQIQIRAKEPNSTVYEVHTYAVDNAAEFTNKLGYQIDFFYPKTSANDTIRTLFSYEIKENATLELNSSMIEKDESNNTTIKYYPTETSSLTNANLASDNIVIYNGKLYGSNADASRFSTDMFPNVGTITVLDSDKDGKYDVVTIWDYQFIMYQRNLQVILR
ncbi:MAG: S-layer homology domain-containing protein [Monoglobus pectinilyticus]